MTKYGHLRDIRLVVTNYSGIFYYKRESGRWVRFNKIGNAGVAEEMLLMFKRVGHNTEVIDKTTDEIKTPWLTLDKQNAKA